MGFYCTYLFTDSAAIDMDLRLRAQQDLRDTNMCPIETIYPLFVQLQAAVELGMSSIQPYSLVFVSPGVTRDDPKLMVCANMSCHMGMIGRL